MRLELKRELSELQGIVAATAAFFAEHGIDTGLRNVVDLATEELFVNMLLHNMETTADILLEMRPLGAGVEVSLTDFDVDRFDPTRFQPVDIDAPAEERTPGGLGLFLVSKMVDAMTYQYKERQSKMTFQVGQG